MSFATRPDHSVSLVDRWRRSVRSWLPMGNSLSEDNWRRRHAAICGLLWVHVLIVPTYGILRGQGVVHALIEGAGILGLLALAATWKGLSPAVRQILATGGLITASALLTHFSGGLIEMHFHFFVVVVVVSLYQAWTPFLVAIGYVVFHHGFMGMIDPTLVFNHPAGQESPWTWALVHGLFIVAVSIGCLAAWRLNEAALEGERHARLALERVTADLAAAQQVANVGSWEWELSSGNVTWSDELFKLLGVDPDTEPSIEVLLDAMHPEDRPRVATLLEATQRSESSVDYECRVRRPDGTIRTMHIRGHILRGDRTTPTRMIGTCQDISDRKALEDEVSHRAFHDSLTGLANRALFLNRLEHAVNIHHREGSPLSVLYLDLDDFKSINDSHGHHAGDALLVRVADRLQAAVRTVDTVARFGGDEFAILLENTEVEGAAELAERILAELRTPLTAHGSDLAPSASIGIAGTAHATASGDLLRYADIAMYAAKRQSKNTHRTFDPEMLTSVLARLGLERELTEAIEQGQFILHYQPIIDMGTGQLEGVEALIRWKHPTRGMVPPGEFIALAEETGQIVDLGTWIIGEATRQTRWLQDALRQPLFVTVNLSAAQVGADLPDLVRSVLDESGLDPAHLILELTETCLMSPEPDTVDALGEIRELGVRIAIDDFGTGYSSLDYLRRLPVDILKIDRAFVAGVTEGPEEAALAHAIVKMADIFGLDTIAEGIEEQEQADALHELGCRLAQGFLFCRPSDARQLLMDDRWQPARKAAPAVQPTDDDAPAPGPRRADEARGADEDRSADAPASVR